MYRNCRARTRKDVRLTERHTGTAFLKHLLAFTAFILKCFCLAVFYEGTFKCQRWEYGAASELNGVSRGCLCPVCEVDPLIFNIFLSLLRCRRSVWLHKLFCSAVCFVFSCGCSTPPPPPPRSGGDSSEWAYVVVTHEGGNKTVVLPRTAPACWERAIEFLCSSPQTHTSFIMCCCQMSACFS